MESMSCVKRLMKPVALLLVFITAITPAMAADTYEFSEKITTLSEIGKDIYPGYTSLEEAQKGMETDLGKEILAALDLLAPEKGISHQTALECIVGYNKNSNEYITFSWVCNKGMSRTWSCKAYSRSAMTDEFFKTQKYAFFVCQGSPEPVPATGDNTPVALMAGALALSGTALVLLKKRGVR